MVNGQDGNGRNGGGYINGSVARWLNEYWIGGLVGWWVPYMVRWVGGYVGARVCGYVGRWRAMSMMGAVSGW